MAKKSRKRDVNIDKASEEEIIIKEIEKNHSKQLFCNFRIHNKFKLNDIHETFLNMILADETKMLIVDGCSGSAKTYLSVYGGLKLLQEKKIEQIIYIRSIAESASKSIGTLPGELSDKFHPWILPLQEKLLELVDSKTAGELMNNDYVKSIPVNFVRGLTFRNSLVIIDEVQNMCREEIVSCITRFGENSKYVLIGDSYQADIGKKSGFKSIWDVFNDEESENMGIHNFVFTENEIVRSKILKFLVRKLEAKI